MKANPLIVVMIVLLGGLIAGSVGGFADASVGDSSVVSVPERVVHPSVLFADYPEGLGVTGLSVHNETYSQDSLFESDMSGRYVERKYVSGEVVRERVNRLSYDSETGHVLVYTNEYENGEYVWMNNTSARIKSMYSKYRQLPTKEVKYRTVDKENNTVYKTYGMPFSKSKSVLGKVVGKPHAPLVALQGDIVKSGVFRPVKAVSVNGSSAMKYRVTEEVRGVNGVQDVSGFVVIGSDGFIYEMKLVISGVNENGQSVRYVFKSEQVRKDVSVMTPDWVSKTPSPSYVRSETK